MKTYKVLFFRVQSNINQYQITITDNGNKTNFIVNSLTDYLCLNVNQSIINLTATPLSSGYDKSLYFVLDVTTLNNCCLNLNLYFMPNPSPDDKRYVFSLTDKTYGLLIDGILHFNQT